MRRLLPILLLIAVACCPNSHGQTKSTWRAATPVELESFLPSRAPVDKERIESEMRTATGITNEHGQMIAAVVLITAGYAADGKYSHYLLLQKALTVGDTLTLPPGAYVIGWSHAENALEVHFFEAANVRELGMVLARPIPQPKRVESFRIWPPDEQHYIQIGRFMLPYSIKN